jgi:hypothetical protein
MLIINAEEAMQQYGPAPLGMPRSSQPAQQPQARPEPISPEESKQQLENAIQGSTEVLASASTTLTIFPDTITIDRAKLTVTKRWFFSAADVMSIRLEDILNVTAAVGPFFGSLVITNRILNMEQPYRIGRLWRRDAIRMKRILQGYVIALQRGIDCSNLPANELADMLDKLGEDNHTA